MSGQGSGFTIRGGKSVAADAVFHAWTSNELERMLKVLDHPTNPIDRHFLLLNICEQLYCLRSNPSMAAEFARIAELHLSEFEQIAPALKAEMRGVLPRVPTFQTYSTFLLNSEEFDRAVSVCQLAISYGLDDGTESGFPGRIERIKKKQAKSIPPKYPDPM